MRCFWLLVLHIHVRHCSYTEATSDTFQVSIDAEGGVRPRRRYEVFNLGDGLFLHQYRVFSDYEALTISITHGRKHVARSPYTISNVLQENCACPLRTAKEWLTDFQCEKSYGQIESDLSPFRKEGGINITGLYGQLEQLFSRWSLIHYSIIDNKVRCVCFLIPIPYSQSLGLETVNYVCIH